MSPRRIYLSCPSIEKIPTYKFFFSYGDFGSIIGRIANYYGLKFGHEGLWLNMMKSTVECILNSSKNNDFDNFDIRQIVARIDLTSNPIKICDFLSYDYDRWLIGFDSVRINPEISGFM